MNIFSYLWCLWDGKSCISDVCFWKQQPIWTIKETEDFMKASMFCHDAQAIKQASIKQLLALTLTHYWEQSECAVQSERRQLSVWSRRMNSYAFTRIPVTRWLECCCFFFLTFDDDCVISISHEGKLVASVGSTCIADALAVSACECLGKPIFLERRN